MSRRMSAIAGSLPLVEVSGGPRSLPANTLAPASPLPAVVPTVCAVVCATLGPFQRAST
jgi:hypothetical protein